MPLFDVNVFLEGCQGAAEAASPDNNTQSAHRGAALREHPDTCWVVLVALCVVLACALWQRRSVARARREVERAHRWEVEEEVRVEAALSDTEFARTVYGKVFAEATATIVEAEDAFAQQGVQRARAEAALAEAEKARLSCEAERVRADAADAAAARAHDMCVRERARAAAAIAASTEARMLCEMEQEREAAAREILCTSCRQQLLHSGSEVPPPRE